MVLSGKASAESPINKANNSLDSIGVEVVDGQQYIIHKIDPKDTYYHLSRTYKVPVKLIMEANNKKNLRVDDLIKVPKGAAPTPKPIPEDSPKKTQETAFKKAPTTNSNMPELATEYKVGKRETLYAISKRFDLKVEDIIRYNKLQSENIQENQILKIPNGPVPDPEKAKELEALKELEELNASPDAIDLSDFKTNRYGIREKSEKGIGVWIEDLTSKGKSNLALHKTAPIGTILKITNPMTKNITYAKVVGRFTENSKTQGAIVVLSRSAANSIGALDQRFPIEINYGLPLDF